MARRTTKGPKSVETLTHDEATRRNIPTAEQQSFAQRIEEIDPFEPVTYERANPLAEGEKRPRDEDLDPQIIWKGATLRLNEEQIAQLSETGKLEIGDAELVWRGKDQQDWSDLVVQAPPLYIQEKIHPKAIIEDLKKQTQERREAESDAPDMFDMFGDFNGIDPEAKTEFYQHDQHWQNRMILGDSLQVMASLAERESLRGKVQCIYFDPPYGISFGSNWQVSTRRRKVADGKLDEITREAEQVKAFRDTWKDGIHSYLGYLRDRLTAMRDLLTESGSIFVQISDENAHRVRTIMDELFGDTNFVSEIHYRSMMPMGSGRLENVFDRIIWYAKDKDQMKYRDLKRLKNVGAGSEFTLNDFKDGDFERLSKKEASRDDVTTKYDNLFKRSDLASSGYTESCTFPINFRGQDWETSSGKSWRTTRAGVDRLKKADRIFTLGTKLYYKLFFSDYPYASFENTWLDTIEFEAKSYVVQTTRTIVQRCLLMATDPGDLVLDPTCGSGTTATVAEQWGRRWITIDTSRVALALARSRLMGTKYPYYLLSDSTQGMHKEQEITGRPIERPIINNDLRQGFVYQRAPRIMLKSIANNAAIDVIWDEYQEKLEPLRSELNAALNESWQEDEIPREAKADWSENIKGIHAAWLDLRIKRQQEIDKSIAQKADVEFLYDRPYEDPSKVRVAGPFTVESLSPHRVIPADDADDLLEELDAAEGKRKRTDQGDDLNDFTQMVMENLKSHGVQQAVKDDKIDFMTLDGWPGSYIAAEGRYMEGETEKRAAVFIGPEFGTITRADLTAAAREALDARFDVLIACGFSFDAHTSELAKLGPLPILNARMNPDLHMSDELKNTGSGNLFVVFGEPDIEWDFDEDGNIVVEVMGVDVFDPKTGDVRASGKGDIAAWFIDADYDEESFFVRHAYFMGANDPYKALKTSLKAEIDKEAWETLYRDTSRPFARPKSGRFAVKVINHFGDEVMKVYGV